jgi:isopentenyl-diphosphate delta-isomerase
MESAHKIVSSDAEELILVDEDDTEIGFLSKAKCHDGAGILHRAFSLFLFNKTGELLLQQRSESKRLWPGYWSNTCCSHPRKGESMTVATRRRLRDELNIETSLEFVYKFSYQAEFDETGSENELCHVYLGKANDAVVPNEHEISAIRFVAADPLLREFDTSPEQFTPWFKLEWLALVEEHRDALSRYCDI